MSEAVRGGGFSAEWPAPPNIQTWITTRSGGVSAPPYDHNNLATHVGDDPVAVAANRQQLLQQLPLQQSPQWLDQLHGTTVVRVPFQSSAVPKADGCWTGQPQQPCAVLTADCMPILITNQKGTRVAALHAGWRGLAAGVIDQGVHCFNDSRDELLVWLGPSIGQNSYEVGEAVREAFCMQDKRAEDAFVPSPDGRWLVSMERLARLWLKRLQVEAVYGGDWDTATDDRFYSYRKEGKTGRFASLIWIE